MAKLGLFPRKTE